MLINLLSNAIKFTDQGGITFTVEVLGQHADADHPVTHIQFHVSDTGVGIAPNQLNYIFQAFEQVGDQKRQSEGTGLELAISQNIVQLMGGQIQVKSQLGVGSDFFLELLLPIATQWVQQNSAYGGRTIIGYEGQRRHLLIVDDRWENRSVIVNLLEPLGFQLTEVENGQMALEAIKQEPFDLIITDLIMPVMDGITLLKQLRSQDETKHLRVIVSSASVAQPDQQISLDAGGDDFLSKPVQIEELLRLLSHHRQLTWKFDPLEPAPSPSRENRIIPSGELIPPLSEDLRILLELAQQGLLRKLTETAEKVGQKSDRLRFCHNIRLNSVRMPYFAAVGSTNLGFRASRTISLR